MTRTDLIQAIEQLHLAIEAVVKHWGGDPGVWIGAVNQLRKADAKYAVPALEWWESGE